jgi:hypothetical protein
VSTRPGGVISSYPDQELEGGPFGLYHLLDDQLMD